MRAGRRTFAVAAALAWALAAGPAAASDSGATVVDHSPGGSSAAEAGGPLPLFELLPSYSRWRSHTFNYFNSAKAFSGPVKQAAAAWNRSGMKGKWKAVPRGRADIIIKVNSKIGVAGLATSWNGNRGLIELNAGTLKGKSPEAKATAGGVVAHEMGHIIGLDHETGCATMNAVLWSGCKQPKEHWLYRCGLLQSDDIRGAVKLLGGRAKKPGKKFCPLEKAPAPVSDLSGSYDAEVTNTYLRWSLSGKNAPASVSVHAGGADGECPKPGKGMDLERTGTVGRDRATDYSPSPGTHCYVVTSFGKLGRPGASTTVKVTSTGAQPEAAFTYNYTDIETLIEFSDTSFDPDGEVVSWSWNFGDGSTSTERNPLHAFPSGGIYTVTLTVRDDSGNVSVYTEDVYV